jgi:hypothetical protein
LSDAEWESQTYSKYQVLDRSAPVGYFLTGRFLDFWTAFIYLLSADQASWKDRMIGDTVLEKFLILGAKACSISE